MSGGCARGQAFEDGMSEADIFEYTAIDPWFLAQLGELHATEQWLRTRSLADLGAEDFLQVKKRGFSDAQIARALGAPPQSPFASSWPMLDSTLMWHAATATTTSA